MNKIDLARKVLDQKEFSLEEKSLLLKFIRSDVRYGLIWEDKSEDVDNHLRKHIPVLVERIDDKVAPILSDDIKNPNHLILEGDNLAALISLAYTHDGKVDIIYIDPPYNTRKKDFKYNDTYIDPEDGFSHSTWLSFMNKRLKVAKNLLSDSGVIFIQIDDREYAPLKMLCDGIFGESNAIGPFIQNKLNTKNDTLNVQRNHEYILCYRKKPILVSEDGSKVKIQPSLIRTIIKERTVIEENGRYYYLNDAITTRGEGGTLNARPNLGYTFYYNPGDNQLRPVADYDVDKARSSNTESVVYTTEKNLISEGFLPIRPPKVRGKLGCWTWDINKAKKEIDNLVVKETKNRCNIYKRTFVPTDQIIVKDGRYIYLEESAANSKSILEFSTNEGTDIFTSIMGYETGFNNPKNVNMIEYLISLYPNKECTVLDFFAGTGTTLHAVLSLNDKDRGKRKCILATNNENRICEEVTYPRNKRVIEGYISTDKNEISGLKDNNLRYYRTEFVPRERTVKNMRELMRASTGLLCIKNDLYTEAEFGGRKMNQKYARYFEQGEKRMLIIYEEEAISFIVEVIKCMEVTEKIKVYVFSHGSYAYNDEFEEVESKVELCALPQAIYDAYQKVLPKSKPQLMVEELVEEIEKEEQTENQGLFSFDNEEEKGGEE